MLFTTLGMDPESERRLMALSIPLLAISGGLVIALVSVVANAIKGSIQTRQREESRREIAAYVAEGTISPDDAFKLLDAGTKKKKSGCC
jgi:hypothetical protein